MEVPTEVKGKARVITFRRVLLTKFQQEFEEDKRDDEEREKMLYAIKETEDVSDNNLGVGRDGGGRRGVGGEGTCIPFCIISTYIVVQ